MNGNYAERRVSELTGIEQLAFCQSIVGRMYDDYNGLGHLTSAEFDAAAIKAARDLFPAAMGVKK